MNCPTTNYRLDDCKLSSAQSPDFAPALNAYFIMSILRVAVKLSAVSV